MTDKPKQARHSACFLSVKTEITCACSDIHPFKKPETSGFPAQLVDISKLGLNSKIKKFSYSFICGKGYSPPKGRIAFCLQPETASCRLHSVDMPRFTLRCKARNFVPLPSCERSRLFPSQLKNSDIIIRFSQAAVNISVFLALRPFPGDISVK